MEHITANPCAFRKPNDDCDDEEFERKLQLALTPLPSQEIEAYQGAIRALFILLGAALVLALATTSKPQEPLPLLLGNPPDNRR